MPQRYNVFPKPSNNSLWFFKQHGQRVNNIYNILVVIIDCF